MCENVRIVEAAIDALNRKEWDAVFSPAAPDFVLDMSRGLGPGRGVYGLDEARRFAEELADYWESMRIEPAEFIEAGHDVVVPYVVHSRGREGIEVISRPTFVWTIRDGAVERVALYQEREDALEAVGLSE
jgi:ketosteroid isomerase-like protein